jgi:hypothetical protein
MAKRSPRPNVRDAARKAAAPFWERVERSGLDRFFLGRLLRALVRRFREDRYARVKQGGLHGDARAELSRVFVDLDATPRVGGRSRGFGERESERIVASWMKAPRPHHPRPGFEALPELFLGLQVEVVLGGPGQGKSTVGRFLSMIHTSILVLSSPIESVATPAEAQQMEALLTSLGAEAIPLPDVVRLPMWIELRELADALLRDDEERDGDALQAMLRWWATNALHEAGDVAAIESALRSLPWVTLLDGLDEVPPERGRVIVRTSIAGLYDRFADADGLVIGTSRPQGYDREVFGSLVERTLLPLTQERAKVYTERLADCLHGDEEGERERLVNRMEKALGNPTTAALMRNPLLVTIMATIVIHHGEPSDRRWTLFEEYYRKIYARETERGTYASSTLRAHADLIHKIHMHVGMSLQARSEQAQGVSALMPVQELRAIIHERLLEGFSEEEATKHAGEILRATEQRLVLLVQSQEGMYGFELRSFQEFMAAWQIASLREAQTSDLLRRIAPLDAWRNVALFVIGHHFANSSPLAWERSVGLCAWLDEKDVAARLTLAGARLALAVLGDAPYGKASKPRDALFARALGLLRVPPSGIHAQLGERLWRVNAEEVLGELGNALDDSVRAESAWSMLLSLPEDTRVLSLAPNAPVAFGEPRADFRHLSQHRLGVRQ